MDDEYLVRIIRRAAKQVGWKLIRHTYMGRDDVFELSSGTENVPDEVDAYALTSIAFHIEAQRKRLQTREARALDPSYGRNPNRRLCVRLGLIAPSPEYPLQ